MIAFVRDFKRFTSKEIQKNIIATEPNVLKLFQADNNKYEFWQKTNMPKLIESEKYFFQKANYIHENPMRKQYVVNPEHWYWSSANPHSVIKTEAIETQKRRKLVKKTSSRIVKSILWLNKKYKII